MISQFRHIRERRSTLLHTIDVERAFDQWKETCVPSYCHSNPAAAYVSWMRLFAAAELADECTGTQKRVLDFGSSVGELRHLLKNAESYEFIEQDEAAASVLKSQSPDATHVTLENAEEGAYDMVFAIDALEHNENFAELVGRLSRLVAPNGVFILSGPTENGLYRLGRRIAGFSGDYHFTTIYDIEKAAEQHLTRAGVKTVPFGIPLFRITAWRRHQ